MRYDQHSAIGVAGLFLLSKVKGLGLDINITSVTTTAIASILADLDCPQSKISNKMYSGITRAITNLLGLVVPLALAAVGYIQFNKLNQVYHFSQNFWNPYIVGAVIFTVASIFIRQQYYLIKKIVAYGVAASLITAGIIKGETILISIGVFIGTYTIARHRSGVTHSIISGIIAYLIVYKIDIRYGMELSKYVFLGYIFHIVSDCFTESGCPIFYPFTDKRYRFKKLKFESVSIDRNKKDKKKKIIHLVLLGANIFLVIMLYYDYIIKMIK